MITAKTEIFYLHYDLNGESLYLKVHTGQQRVTLVSVSGKKGNQGKYCRGVYNITWTTFVGNYGYYNKYWPRGKYAGSKDIEGAVIGHRMKFTSKNQYERAKAEVLNSLI